MKKILKSKRFLENEDTLYKNIKKINFRKNKLFVENSDITSELLELENAFYTQEQKIHPQKDFIEDESGMTDSEYIKFWKTQIKDCETYGYFIDERLVGFLRVLFKEKIFGYNTRFAIIKGVYIKPRYRGLGIFSELLNFTEDEAKIRDCDFINLSVLAGNSAEDIYLHKVFEPYLIQMFKEL